MHIVAQLIADFNHPVHILFNARFQSIGTFANNRTSLVSSPETRVPGLHVTAPCMASYVDAL